MSNFTREQLRRFDMRPDTGFGQHFLADDNTLDVILRMADVIPGEVVYEPGPGVGTLTRALADAGATVYAVELDERLREPLAHATAGYSNVEVAFGDALARGAETVMPLPTALVSNLPYDVSVPILAETLQRAPTVRRFCVMLQAEVADRLQARPSTRDYGAVSVLVQALCSFTGRHAVGRGVFIPQPNVDSAILAFDRNREPVADVGAFSRFVRTAFQFRRKTLHNNLVQALDTDRETAREAIAAACAAADCAPSDRPEALDPETFVAIYRALAPLLPQRAACSVAAPAKCNRLLAVGPAREDGFHEIVTCVEPISWVDAISVEPADADEDVVEVRRVAVPGGDTLVTRALAALRAGFPELELPPQRVVIEKTIPAGAGLGGGTGNAAAVMRLLGERHGIDVRELVAVAAQAGSDTPAQLFTTPVIARGRGDDVQPVTARPPDDRWLCAWPASHAATADVFARFDEQSRGATQLPTDADIAAWLAAPSPRNDLTDAATSIDPACQRLLALMAEASPTAWVTGSGSACLCELPIDPRPLISSIRAEFPAAAVRVVRPLGAR